MGRAGIRALSEWREPGQARECVADGVKRSRDEHGRRVLLCTRQRPPEVGLERVRHRETAELTLQPSQIPAAPFGGAVGNREDETVDLPGEAVDHPEIVLVAEHSYERAAQIGRAHV